MPDDELRRAIDAAWMGSEQRNWIPGRLGKVNPDGTVSLETGRTGYVYVRVGPEGHVATSVARNVGAPLKAHLPVRMRLEKGELVIHGANYAGGLTSFNNGNDSGYTVGRHTHALGSGLEYPVEALRLAPGRVQWSTGLTVTIFPFRYYYNATWETWEGGTIDLTSYKPASGKWCWVLVGINPATNTAVAVKGADQDNRTALTVGLIDSIAFLHYIPCAAVQVSEADTVLSDIGRWVDAHGWLNGGLHRHVVGDIDINVLGTPTYTTLEHYIDVTGSKGLLWGGEITPNVGGNAVDVSAGEGFIRAVDNDDLETLYLIEWSAGVGLSITESVWHYIVVYYNSGTPGVTSTTSIADLDDEDLFLIGEVYNEDGTLHIINLHDSVSSGVHRTQHTLRDIWGPIRAHHLGGLIVNETGTRNITLSAGEIYYGTNEFVITALDTSGSDTFDAYYRDTGSAWIKVAAQTQWPNTQYDNGSATLQDLTANHYGVLWWYIETDGALCMIYGRGNYVNVASAVLEEPPFPIPPRLTGHSILAARTIFQKSAATGIFSSAYTTTFTPTDAGISDHGGLAGLADDDHAQYALLAGRAGGQVLQGGTASGDDLTLESTADATKGYVLLNPNGGGVGVNMSTPAAPLDILGTGTATLRIRGADSAVEIADIYVDSDGSLVITTVPGTDTGGFFDLRTEDNDYGLVIRKSDGTATAPFANIYVVDDADDDYVSINVSSVTDGDALVITAANLIGIGTASPGVKLHVYEDVNGSSVIRLQNPNAGASNAVYLALTGDGGTTQEGFLAKYGINYPSVGSLLKLQNKEGDLQLATDSVTVTLKDATERVGIGTTDPQANLHIYQDVNSGVPLRIENPNAGNGNAAYLYLVTDGGTAQAAQIAKYGVNHASYASRLSLYNSEGDIWLHTDGVDVYQTDAGRVGIGVVPTTEKLEVNGNILADGLTFGTDIMTVYNTSTYSPVITPTTGAFTTLTYTVNVGKFTQIGNIVFYSAYITINAYNVGTASGDVRLSLPGTVGATGPDASPGPIYLSGVDLQANTRSIAFEPFSSAAWGRIYETQDNGASYTTQISAIAAGDSFVYSGFYFV